MSSIESAPPAIPATSVITFADGFAPRRAGQGHMIGDQLRQPHPVGQAQQRDQARGVDQVRVVENR